MGFSFSEVDWLNHMEICEDRLIAFCKSKDRIMKDNVCIEMDEKPFRVRTITISPEVETPDTKTLLLVHGFWSSALIFYRMFDALSEKYKVILIDSMSHGINSRPKSCSGIASPEAAEAWQLEWIEKVIDAIPALGQKFLLSGHSHGGWLVSLFASKHPERVEQLFLIAPGGMYHYDPATYNPYRQLVSAPMKPGHKQPKAQYYDKTTADQLVTERDDCTTHPYKAAHGIPFFILRQICLHLHVKTELDPNLYTNEEIHAYNDYYALMAIN